MQTVFYQMWNTYLTVATLKKHFGVYMYNLKIKRYPETGEEQVTIYSQRVREDIEPRKYNNQTGEIYGIGRLKLNPFTNEYECMKEIDGEHSEYNSYMRTKHKIYDIVRANKWELFITLTFNKEKVERFDYDDCVKKLRNWIINTKRTSSDWKYVIVPESHKDGAWHFHGLCSRFNPSNLSDSGLTDNEGRIIYNITNYNLGWTTATYVGSTQRASSYLLKYVTKDLCKLAKGKERYWSSRNLSLPKIETIHVLESEQAILRKLTDIEYIKSVETAVHKVTYIEKPIYTTNASQFVTSSITSDDLEESL